MRYHYKGTYAGHEKMNRSMCSLLLDFKIRHQVNISGRALSYPMAGMTFILSRHLLEQPSGQFPAAASRLPRQLRPLNNLAQISWSFLAWQMHTTV